MSHILPSTGASRSFTRGASHDPLESLAALCIRQTFGSSVQLVTDALQSRGEMTLAQLVTYLRQRTLVTPAQPTSFNQPRRRLGVVTGKRQSPTDRASVRAALIVLLQHEIVTIRVQKQPSLINYYTFQPQRARRLLRYAKYIEFLKKVILVGDEVASSVLQTLLISGRLRTIDWMAQAVKFQQQQPNTHADPRYTLRQQVVEAAYKLETQGLVVPVAKLNDEDEEESDEEFEFEGEERPAKRPRLAFEETTAEDGEDPSILALLHGSAHYKHALPVDRVWKVNLQLFHAYQRAYQLGRLVAERYGHKVQSCGSLVTAALKFNAQQRYNPNEQRNSNANAADSYGFTANDIVKYIPKPVLQIMEKKLGGVQRNIPKAFEDLVQIAIYPIVVRPLTTFATTSTTNQQQGGGDGDASARFELRVEALVDYLQERVIHQVVHDRLGLVAARAMSILSRLGYLESDTLAEHAMVPVKDMRGILHQLFRSQYVELVQLSTRQQYSTANAIYLWGVHKSRLKTKVLENVAKALRNIRLRREHELEIGKQWIQRAQQAADTDENDHAKDRLNYTKFCLGLERLDVAALQLDDTFLVLNDFQ